MTIEPISTSIKKLIAFDGGYLILEDYYGFKGKSNFYFVKNDKVVWFAEQPTIGDAYVNFDMQVNSIVAWSWSCFRVKIDNDGKIVESVFTK